MKNKILLSTSLAIVTPTIMVVPLYSCSPSPVQPITGNVIPYDYLSISRDGVLGGFSQKAGDLSSFDTLCIPKEVISVANYAFYNPHTDKTILPDNIINLTYEKVYEIHEEEHETLETKSNCVSIGDRAFYKSPLKHVILPYGVKKIGDFAFSHSKVEDCYFPPYLNIIGEEAFSNTNIVEVAFHELRERQTWEKRGAPDVFDPSFKSMPNIWYWGPVVEGSYVTQIGKKAFFDCDKLLYHRATPLGSAYPQGNSIGDSVFSNTPRTNNLDGRSTIRCLDFTTYFGSRDESFRPQEQLPTQEKFCGTFGIPNHDLEPNLDITTKSIICTCGIDNELDGPLEEEVYNAVAAKIGAQYPAVSKDACFLWFWLTDPHTPYYKHQTEIARNVLYKRQTTDEGLPCLFEFNAAHDVTCVHYDMYFPDAVLDCGINDFKFTIIPETIKWKKNENVKLSAKQEGDQIVFTWDHRPSKDNYVTFELLSESQTLGIHERSGYHPCWEDHNFDYDNSVKITFE